MTRPARAGIDLPALRHNYQRARQAAPHSRVMAIVKANAYGHGLVRVAQTLADCDAFGVACVEDAIALREAGCNRRIVLLEGIFSADELDQVSIHALDTVIHHATQIAFLEQCRLTRPLDVWVKVDTGMHRLGFDAAAVPAAVNRLRGIGNIATIRFLTHFACADDVHNDYTRQQSERFGLATERLAGERSLANSAAVLGWPEMHHDWVRPGIMLYGGSPLSRRSAGELGLQPVMTLGTRLIAINTHQKGAAVGYGGDWICPETMPVGVAAIGYGDGYPRHAPTGTPVLLHGKRAALIGRVSMDMICIDLRTHPGVKVGDPVTLWGEGMPVDEIAERCGTISYELLCGVNRRVQFDYLE
jgi:alanine racemase